MNPRALTSYIAMPRQAHAEGLIDVSLALGSILGPYILFGALHGAAMTFTGLAKVALEKQTNYS